MEFAEFILAHDGDDLGRLALARERYAPDFPDFDLALTTLEVRAKLRKKVPAWYAVPSLRFPLRLSAEQCSSAETARYKASVAAMAGVAPTGTVASRPLPSTPSTGPSLLRGRGWPRVPVCESLAMADLTGGLGVDSWAFAQVFDAVLYNEMRPELAAAAAHNFRELGLTNVTVRSALLVPGESPVQPGRTVMTGPDRSSPEMTVREILGDFRPDVIFLDPARRAADGRKVFRLEDCQPDVLQLLPELLAACPLLLLKLSPMADITLVCKQLGCVRAVHVVATEGECKELLLLLERGHEGPYSITVYDSGAIMSVDQVQGVAGPGPISGVGPGPGSMAQRPLEGILLGPSPRGESGPGPQGGWTRSSTGIGGSGEVTPAAGKLLFEPGKGLLKAGAFDLPCRYGLTKLGRHTHLYVGEAVPEALKPFGKTFEILEVLPLNKQSFKALGKKYPRAEVSAHNIPLSAEALRAKLGVRSGGAVHIFGLHLDASAENVLLVTGA